MFQRARISLQILMTLISFFGFNEALLASRYRNSIYLNNMGCPAVCQDDEAESKYTTGYGLSEALFESVEASGFDGSFSEFVEECLEELNHRLGEVLIFSLDD